MDDGTRQQLHNAVAERLRAADQRYTKGRRAIVELLADAPRPSTIPELLARRPSLAQSSAYRNLVVLEEIGVAHRVVTSDERWRYELAPTLDGGTEVTVEDDELLVLRESDVLAKLG